MYFDVKYHSPCLKLFSALLYMICMQCMLYNMPMGNEATSQSGELVGMYSSISILHVV